MMMVICFLDSSCCISSSMSVCHSVIFNVLFRINQSFALLLLSYYTLVCRGGKVLLFFGLAKTGINTGSSIAWKASFSLLAAWNATVELVSEFSRQFHLKGRILIIMHWAVSKLWNLLRSPYNTTGSNMFTSSPVFQFTWTARRLDHIFIVFASIEKSVKSQFLHIWRFGKSTSSPAHVCRLC